MGAIPWTFQAVSNADRTPPPHPSTMRKWRRKVADAILALLEGGAHLSPATAELQRPSPLDWDWFAPEPVALAYGQEMLPPSDFEANMGPWRVESWEGSGSGELDSGTAHGGKQSVRVDVPAAEGNKAVTVVVWPTWGGGGLDLTLDRDHLYEFAAWVRLENRGSPPDLRLSLPAGAERAVASGRGNVGADGWQRIWRRVELDFPAQPRYIAAWVQGPGTIWIDDLSLREAAPPALSVALDQSEYDDLDRVGLATVEISRLVTPASVRFVLASAGGEAAGTLTVPFRPQDEVAAQPNRLLSLIAPADLTTCRLALEPASLPAGDYVLSTVLLDAQGAALGEDTVSFRRLPD